MIHKEVLMAIIAFRFCLIFPVSKPGRWRKSQYNVFTEYMRRASAWRKWELCRRKIELEKKQLSAKDTRASTV